jgi:hypothetical protein
MPMNWHPSLTKRSIFCGASAPQSSCNGTIFPQKSSETQGWLKPNFLHPPFNNKKAREALLHMMDQVTYLALAIGQSQYYHPCYSIFACGGPCELVAGISRPQHLSKRTIRRRG